MNRSKFARIHYEPRMEIRSDLSIIETFQDGSQLIRNKGHMVIVEASRACIGMCKVTANPDLFSRN